MTARDGAGLLAPVASSPLPLERFAEILDPEAFEGLMALKQRAAALLAGLADEQLAARLGDAAHARVREEFLEPRHLAQWADLIERLSAGR